MPWFKVDDKFHDHRKVRRVSLDAIGLWTMAGSWASDNLTDGFIPVEIARRWTKKSPKLAAELVTAGLWVETEIDGESGWGFHDWHERNPLRVKVEADREAARERMGRVRGSRSENVRANTERTPDEGSNEPPEDGSDLFADGSPTPSRPVPTVVPNGTTRGAKRATQLPADWSPKDDHLKIANEYGLDPAFELRAFRDHHEAKGTTYKSWDAAFRTWLNKSRSFKTPAYSTPSPMARRHVPLEVPAHIDPDDGPAYAAWLREEAK